MKYAVKIRRLLFSDVTAQHASDEVKEEVEAALDDTVWDVVYVHAKRPIVRQLYIDVRVPYDAS